MIEADVIGILQANTTITTALGGVAKIFYIQPSTTATMPWLFVEAAAPTPERMGASKQQVTATVRITMNIAQTSAVKGRGIMEDVKKALQGLRGDATESKDLFIQCSDITGYPGVGATAIFNIVCTCKFMEDWSTQHI
jgi:hypothetical protein